MKELNLSRRGFLKVSGGGLAAWGLAGLPTLSGGARLAFAPERGEPDGDILVCVFLRGGMDGLNAVVPQFEAEYYRRRPTLAIPESSNGDDGAAIDLDGRFGLHPALRPLKDLWDAGRLAVVHAVGSPDPTHSHFDAQDFMERGTPGDKTVSSGWLARHLSTAPWQNESPFRAVGLGGVLPTSLRGPTPVTTLQSIVDFHLQGRVADLARLQQTLASLYALDGGLASAAQDTLDAVEMLSDVDVSGNMPAGNMPAGNMPAGNVPAGNMPAGYVPAGNMPAGNVPAGNMPAGYVPANGVEYPETEFGQSLLQVAQLVKAEIGLEVAGVDLGGFDTHVNQGGVEGALARLLDELAGGLAAFYHDLDDRIQAVTLVTMTEFGRRVTENGNGGTDHGHGGVMLALGGGVNGGQVYADWPGLSETDLYGPGDLAVTTDFRDVLGELVQKRLGNAANLATVFPGYEVRPHGIFAGPV